MAVFVLLVFLGVVVMTISEAIRKVQDRKGWRNGVEYDRHEYAGVYEITARVIADPEKKEFKVRMNHKDGHFYDSDNTGYHATELYIKNPENHE